MTHTGRRPGTHETRVEVLAAATQTFAEVGYERATIRAIAGRAGVDPALIHHYYGTKAALFAAATQLPVNPVELLGALRPGRRGSLGRRLVAFFLSTWDPPERRAVLLGIIRGAVSEPSAADRLREVVTRFPVRIVAGLVGGANAQLRATLMGSQLVGLAMARYVLRVEPLASASADDVAELVGSALQTYLDGPRKTSSSQK